MNKVQLRKRKQTRKEDRKFIISNSGRKHYQLQCGLEEKGEHHRTEAE